MCSSPLVKKSGTIEKMVMTDTGKRKRILQAYRCAQGHYFHRAGAISSWDESFIEIVVYVYLQCLSLNTTVDIIRGIYKEDVLTKGQVLQIIEVVADAIPTIDDVDRLFNLVYKTFISCRLVIISMIILFIS